jgi:hypothetical protein
VGAYESVRWLSSLDLGWSCSLAGGRRLGRKTRARRARNILDKMLAGGAGLVVEGMSLAERGVAGGVLMAR